METPAENLHIEVKSTTRRGRLRIYLSRNEFETMRREAPGCSSRCVSMTPVLAAVATIGRDWLAAAAPSDNSGGRWESVKIDVPPGALHSGIAPLAERAFQCGLPILCGSPVWPVVAAPRRSNGNSLPRLMYASTRAQPRVRDQATPRRSAFRCKLMIGSMQH